MQSRSRMAALAIFAGLSFCVATAASPAAEPSTVNKVNLKVQITGLGQDGCVIEIKPGHPACSFDKITRSLDFKGRIEDLAIAVKSTSADRDCLFAITVKEPGRPPKTYKRGLRLETAVQGKGIPTQDLICLLRSPSLVAREDSGRKVK